MKLHVSATTDGGASLYCLRDAAELRIATIQDAPNALETALRLAAAWNTCEDFPTPPEDARKPALEIIDGGAA